MSHSDLEPGSAEAAERGDHEPVGLRSLDLAIGYDTADQALRDFYVPALAHSVRYDRSVGYFRASALSAAAIGLSRFIAGGGTARFLVGAEIGEGDREALIGATEVPPALAQRLASELVPADEVAERRLQVLAWLVREKRLDIRVAVAIGEDGAPVPPGVHVPYFHEKIGVLRDAAGDGVAFQGSVNESASAWSGNFESFSVYFSWRSSAEYFDHWQQCFENRWKGVVPGFRVYPLPAAVEAKLVGWAPAEPPPHRDPAEPVVRADRRTLARFLRVTPRLVGTPTLAEATSGVKLFPHQRKVAERLAGQYPRSWLVADEVGLGKTISAGVSLRRLLLSGEVERALILAPANVCRQWQDELFERFGLWVPRYDNARIWGAHPDDVNPVPPGSNPYADHPLLLVSSHLARLSHHRRLLLQAPKLDLLVVDEAHHARRRGGNTDERRPSRLLELLDEVARSDHSRAVWLLTATPMQVHPVELFDLLEHVGLAGALGSFSTFERYHAELAKADDSKVNWRWLQQVLTDSPRLPLDAADQALLDQMAVRVGPVNRRRIVSFGDRGADVDTLAQELGSAGRTELRAWLRQRGPVGQFVTRHSRGTLKRYRAQGLLDEPVADRDVQARPVRFSRDEQELYDALDALLDRLMQAHGTKRGAGFVLTVYRRRLTSSWTAITRTLKRRINNERLLLDEAELDEADESEDALDTGEHDTIDDQAALPLTVEDLADIERYVGQLESVADSKFDYLQDDLNEARGSGQPVIVFSQFADTLDHLRGRLQGIFRSQLATYSGNGGRHWQEVDGKGEWVRTSKQELVEALRSGRISVILATDAASEGLNLQTASYLINYDLPWNPMRVEQRIGRIDRIGQAAPIIKVRNYVIPGTVEESVYRALADRIDLFSGMLGQLQPILGATEGAFKQVFRAPRSERARAQSQAIDDLLARVGELEASGIELTDEDGQFQ